MTQASAEGLAQPLAEGEDVSGSKGPSADLYELDGVAYIEMPDEPVYIDFGNEVKAVSGELLRMLLEERRDHCRICGRKLSRFNASGDCWSHGRPA